MSVGVLMGPWREFCALALVGRPGVGVKVLSMGSRRDTEGAPPHALAVSRSPGRLAKGNGGSCADARTRAHASALVGRVQGWGMVAFREGVERREGHRATRGALA